MNTKAGLVLKAVACVARATGKVVLEVGTVFGILLFAWAESRSTDDDSQCRDCDEWYRDVNQQTDWK